MDKLYAWTQRFALAGLWFGGGLIFASALLVSADVLGRKLLDTPIGAADELAGYAMAIGTAWALPFAMLQRVNVRVDVLYQSLPLKLRVALDLLALLALSAFVFLLTRHALDVVLTSWSRGSLSNTALQLPLWIPQGLWWLGLASFIACAAVALARCALALARRDLAWLHQHFGARTIQEDAADEAAPGRARTHAAQVEATP